MEISNYTPTYVFLNAEIRGGCWHNFILMLLDKEQGQGTCFNSYIT